MDKRTAFYAIALAAGAVVVAAVNYAHGAEPARQWTMVDVADRCVRMAANTVASTPEQAHEFFALEGKVNSLKVIADPGPLADDGGRAGPRVGRGRQQAAAGHR